MELDMYSATPNQSAPNHATPDHTVSHQIGSHQIVPNQISNHSTPNAIVAAPAQLDSRVLLNGAQEVRIAHYGQEYRLRQTRNGKLILTK
jgi:hemin uptake protein HemP